MLKRIAVRKSAHARCNARVWLSAATVVALVYTLGIAALASAPSVYIRKTICFFACAQLRLLSCDDHLRLRALALPRESPACSNCLSGCDVNASAPCIFQSWPKPSGHPAIQTAQTRTPRSAWRSLPALVRKLTHPPSPQQLARASVLFVPAPGFEAVPFWTGLAVRAIILQNAAAVLAVRLPASVLA